MQNTIEPHIQAFDAIVPGTATVCRDRYCTGYLLTSGLRNHVDLHKYDVLYWVKCGIRCWCELRLFSCLDIFLQVLIYWSRTGWVGLIL